MAFVHDLEADKIDDSNLFSAFVKVPLLILGGVLGGGKSESSSSKENSSMDEDMDGSSSTGATHPIRESNSQCDGSDDAMDCSSSSSTRLDKQDSSNVSSPQHPNCRIVSDTDIDETDTDMDGLKRGKKMSWSDSVGLSLVEYNDEVRPCCVRISCNSDMKK